MTAYYQQKENESVIQAITTDYERFILNSADLDHQGLYLSNGRIFALIPNLTQSEREKVLVRYDDYRCVGVPPPNFCASIESEAERLPLSQSWQKVNLHGYPFSRPEASNELNIHLPKKFHPFQYDYKLGTNVFELKLRFRPSDEEYCELGILLANLGYDQYELKVVVDECICDYPCGELEEAEEKNVKTIDPHILMLKARAFLPKHYPKEVLDKYEEDEEFWVDHKLQVFTDPNFSQHDFIHPSFSGQQTCFVDGSLFQRQNIREYLVLYRTVIIALPFNDTPQLAVDFYQMFCLTHFELKELIQRGRLKFVLTQNLKRYSIELIRTIINVDSNAIILSRTLASSTVIGMRNRSGVLGHTLNTDEQFHLIRSLMQADTEASHKLGYALARTWGGMEYSVNKMGAAGISHIGMGKLLASLHNQKTESEMMLGMFAQSYEFSQGLGAHHFPYDDPSEPSYLQASERISACYSGVRQQSSEIRQTELNTLLSKVFSVNNDMDVLELDRVFSGKEIPFAAELLKDYSNLSSEALEQKLMILRQDIGKLETNKNRLSKWQMTGFIGGVATLASSEPHVSLLVWAMTCAGGFIKSGSNSEIFNKLAALNNRTSRDVVLIKRAREDVARIIG